MTTSRSTVENKRRPGTRKKKRRKHGASARIKYVYVIELDRNVLSHKKFRDRNPDRDPAKACLYVGKTGRTPDERFKQHKAGYKSNRLVEQYGKYLRRRLYEKHNPMTDEEAVAMEVELAEDLRRKGYAVWQG